MLSECWTVVKYIYIYIYIYAFDIYEAIFVIETQKCLQIVTRSFDFYLRLVYTLNILIEIFF